MEEILQKLHPLERKILAFLKDGITFSELLDKSGMKEIEIMRALQWLSNKGIIKINEEKKQYVELDVNGKEYVKKGLPERRFFDALSSSFELASELKQKAQLNDLEFGISTGILKNQGVIASENIDGKFYIKKIGNSIPKTKILEEFLEKLNGKSICVDAFTDSDKFSFEELKKRKQIIKIETKKNISVELTSEGKNLLSKIQSENIDLNVLDRLNHEMLKNKSWKGKKFRHYDILINVPSIHGGKRHFVKQSIDYIKKVWLEMGFKEMEGTMVQSAFWDLDALFVPQDHPARTMQDTFYIKSPAKAKLPNELKEKIRSVHENGADTGSKGWKTKWSEEEASLNIMRTHTTVLSARTLAKLKKSEIPAKFFSVNKVYRNEVLNWKHLFEFHQVEGIVVDPNATLSHLKGYLREFYLKLGFKEIRMRPAHFPYTEPSLEVEVFHPERKEWVELGGAGIFRPEVVKPLLGIDIPVLAWGQGIERGIMGYYKFNDIRQLYDNDIKRIKEVKIWR